ncbi:Major facilitator superfamily domain general substrate transporter [Penicillium bovifimosum]|uniref:Major facilitator superfamily domain general substrate transporter n=1 Tax=Penicillium bovifimosum TaxID=126998 RepID=A0A9W9L4E2_9EURO|nr:Major facilitator superfamily domain general substrate transporter [Penicillium bovifimosum]KAJ5135662.1 Major facilitator superfamily domain general substrate transporter [Penicillium bovifimosum]
MSTQTQTETIVLQSRASHEATPAEHELENEHENEHEILQHSPPVPKWLYFKVLSAALSFFVAGINDGSLGSIIPYVIRTYNIGTDMVAVVYATTFLGWLIAALTNSPITKNLNLGPILTLGASLQVLAHILRVWEPPFPLYCVTFFLASLGQAYNDTHANTFISALPSAHRYLGFIHAMYMAGCLVGPFVATAVASANAEPKWALFYLFPVGVGVLNLVSVAAAFRDRMVRSPVVRGEGGERSALREIRDTLSTPGVWLVSLFFFFFLGAAITASGWMVEYLVVVRNGNVKEMGYIPAGYFGGGFLGRLILAEPTHRLGERRMIFIYAVLCVGLQLVFWLVPNIITEAVAVSLLGFFSGPFFATGISVGTKIFAPEIRSSAIAFVFVLGQIGGSVFPALTGIIAGKVGVQVLQPMLVGLLGAAGVSWLMLPKDVALHRD